jgi:uncharacterized protein (TIGR02646 family)
MIKIDRPPAPDVLTAPDGPADRESRNAKAHYADPATRSESFTFRVYKHTQVKAVLNQAFHFKCAYCESSFDATAPVDIEHFRPKLAVKREDGQLVKPGYYWLAAEWDNLLPSCIDCNRARIHDHAGMEDPELSGKANLFPIQGDNRLNLDPGAEKGEKRHLIHPCRDTVEIFFVYKSDEPGVSMLASDGISSASKRKADKSIEVYGLNRIGLVRARGDQRLRLKNQVDSVGKSLRDLAKTPDDEDIQREMALAICELIALESDQAEYAGMTRELTVKVHTSLNTKLATVLGNRLDAFEGDTTEEKLLAKFPCPPREFDDVDDLADLLN